MTRRANEGSGNHAEEAAEEHRWRDDLGTATKEALADTTLVSDSRGKPQQPADDRADLRAVTGTRVPATEHRKLPDLRDGNCDRIWRVRSLKQQLAGVGLQQRAEVLLVRPHAHAVPRPQG